MPKRRPEDVLKDIEDSETADAVERVTAMTPAERRSELEAAGYTEAELDAKADEWHARMERAAVDAGKAQLEAEARAKSLRPPANRGRRPLLLVAAVAVAAIALALVLLPRPRPREAPIAAPSATAPPSATVGASAPTPSAPPPDAAAPSDDKPRLK
jgi:hypothetical protein